MSAVGNEEITQISDRATPTDEEKQMDEQGAQAKSAVVAAPVQGGREEVRKPEPLENAEPTVETEAVVEAAQAPAAAEAEAPAMAHGMSIVETEAVVVAAQEAPVAAEEEATAVAHGTPEDEAQAREREECKKLVNVRAEKLLLIKGKRTGKILVHNELAHPITTSSR